MCCDTGCRFCRSDQPKGHPTTQGSRDQPKSHPTTQSVIPTEVEGSPAVGSKLLRFYAFSGAGAIQQGDPSAALRMTKYVLRYWLSLLS